MKNFIFKSNDSDLQKIIYNKLEIIQKELRFQRQDHVNMARMLQTLTLDKGLQKQVDDYFEDDAEDKAEHIPDKNNEE